MDCNNMPKMNGIGSLKIKEEMCMAKLGKHA